MPIKFPEPAETIKHVWEKTHELFGKNPETRKLQSEDYYDESPHFTNSQATPVQAQNIARYLLLEKLLENKPELQIKKDSLEEMNSSSEIRRHIDSLPPEILRELKRHLENELIPEIRKDISKIRSDVIVNAAVSITGVIHYLEETEALEKNK